MPVVSSNHNRPHILNILEIQRRQRSCYVIWYNIRDRFYDWPLSEQQFEDYVAEKYTNPGAEPCKVCWPCREKYWAYGLYDFNTPEDKNEWKL